MSDRQVVQRIVITAEIVDAEATEVAEQQGAVIPIVVTLMADQIWSAFLAPAAGK
jgi:hypothetical protein